MNGKDKIGLIHDALLSGIRDYFGKLQFNKAILGLSGGIDSAVTALLAAKHWGLSMHCVLMPSPFSSGHSVSDSEALCRRNGISYTIIPIDNMYEQMVAQMHPVFGDLSFDVTEENMQARIRV